MARFLRAVLAFLPILSALLLPLFDASAGPVSLDPPEIQNLQTLLRTDPNAAAQFATIRNLADTALAAQPAPVEKVISEGHLATDPRKIQSTAALKDLPETEALAWSWVVTSDPRYLAGARTYLTAWAKVNQPDGDPINETKFEPMIVAYDLVRTGLQQPDRGLVEAWLRGKAAKLMAVKIRTNNWGCHTVKVVGLIGLTLNDADLTSWAVQNFKNMVEVDIRPDGSTADFHDRDALHYHLYAVEPLLSMARAEARQGTHLFDDAAPSGATLHAAVDFVIPFAEGTQTHIEFVHSKVKFDQQRAKDGEAEYAPHPWDPKTSIEMFSEAAWFLPKYGVLAAQIAGKPGQTYLNWQMVINAVSRKGN
jgi:hypothetical protein